MQHKLLQDIGQELYSLIVDESTDVGMQKQTFCGEEILQPKAAAHCLYICWSNKLDGGDADTIADALLAFLQESKRVQSNVLGFGPMAVILQYVWHKPFTAHTLQRAQPQHHSWEMCVTPFNCVLHMPCVCYQGT